MKRAKDISVLARHLILFLKGGVMLKRSVAFALLLGLFGFSGCSKALTNSSAVSLTQKFIDARASANPETAKLGHLVVDSCDQLFLTTETMATATCKVHMVWTVANRPTELQMKATFGKQPDGNWIVTDTQSVR